MAPRNSQPRPLCVQRKDLLGSNCRGPGGAGQRKEQNGRKASRVGGSELLQVFQVDPQLGALARGS